MPHEAKFAPAALVLALLTLPLLDDLAQTILLGNTKHIGRRLSLR